MRQITERLNLYIPVERHGLIEQMELAAAKRDMGASDWLTELAVKELERLGLWPVKGAGAKGKNK